MASLLDRVRSSRQPQRSTIDFWLENYLLPSTFGYNGHQYGIGLDPQQTLVDKRVREIANTLPAYMTALRFCPPAFAAQAVRSLVLSQARFMFRRRPWVKQNPRALFGNASLETLEEPWPNGTTADLLGRMEWHAGLAGNAYVTNFEPNRLRVLRPDWVQILYGSDQNPEEAAYALDGEVIAYLYTPGGNVNTTKPRVLLPEQVAHYAPLPDPEGAGIGMSWLTPALRDMQVDRATTDHKLSFFNNGATPNMVVKGLKATTQKQFDDMVDALERDHVSVYNAYRTLYLSEGADVSVVGNNFTDMALRALQDGGEARIAVLSRVPAAMLGISEGLRGSALNESSFAMARRVFADTWLTASLQNISASLAPLVNVPGGAELWFDTTDIPIMREDAQDATNIEQVKQTTIVGYVNAGFTAESAIAAVDGQDVTLLVHTDLVSVQLQPPGAQVSDAGAATDAAGAGTGTPDNVPPKKQAARTVGFAPPFVPATPTRYSDDEPRDYHGRWTADGADPDLTGIVTATNENEGGSFKFEKGRLVQPTTGHMVAQRGGKIVTEKEWRANARQALRDFRAANADAFARGAYLGTWHDTAHGEFALDVSWNIQDKDEAMAFARANNQQAGWDVVKQEAWDAGGTGDRAAGRAAGVRPVAGQLGRHDDRGPGLLAGLRHRPDWLRYDEDEPRDEIGRWTTGGAVDVKTTYSELDAKGQARVDARLLKAGVTIEQLQNEIRNRLTPEAIAKYGQWYEGNHDVIVQLAQDNGLSLEDATAVVAVCSPAMEWGNNLDAARSVMAYVKSGAVDGLDGRAAYAKWADATPTKDGRWNLFSEQGSKAFDVALGNKEPADILTTVKVGSFYDNLLQPGATREVTVDRHMLKAFGFATDGGIKQNEADNLYGASVTENKVVTTPSIGAVAIAEAVRAVSRDLNIPPDSVQATYWSLVIDKDYP